MKPRLIHSPSASVSCSSYDTESPKVGHTRLRRLPTEWAAVPHACASSKGSRSTVATLPLHMESANAGTAA